MKKLALSLAVVFAVGLTSPVLAQDSKETKKECTKTEKKECSKEEKKSCCSADKKSTGK